MITRFLKEFFLGIRSIYEAFVFVFQYWLWPFYFIPVVISIGIYYGGDMLLQELKSSNFQDDLNNLNFQYELDHLTFQGFPTDAAEIKLLIIGLKLVAMVTALKLNKYIVLILLSPLLTFLSAKTEQLITNNHYPFRLSHFVEDIYRGINFSLRNMFVQMFIYALWFGASTVLTPIQSITPVFYFIVGAYFYGASLLDYTNERRRLSMDESIKFIQRHAGLTMAIGSIFLTFFFTAHIGIIIGPITCVIAATIAIHYKFNLSKSKHAIKKEPVQKTVKKAEVNYEPDEWG